MRNLKRALSLTLASVMLLGMMVVGAGAAGFPDVDEDTHDIEAIEVLKEVEVMIGDDNGNFGPDDLVNRSQMAVVMAKLLNLNYEYYEATCPFWDVPTWARGYVGACYAKGIVSGYGDGTYGAADGVTAVQAASMMMRALGYFQHAEDYNGGFELTTVSKGSDIGIFDGVGSNATASLTRNQVARMALNALESEMVTFTGTPGTTYTSSNGETLSIGYRAEYTPRTSTELKYTAIEDRTSDASDNSNHRGQYYIQLGEELYNGKLTKRFDRDDFMRPSINWQYDGKNIGTYVDYDLLVTNGTYTDEVKYSALYDLLTYTTIRDNDLDRYVDGVDQNESKDNFSRSNDTKVGGRGVLTEVFYDQDRDEITITSINTYLAKANSDYNKNNETLSLKVYDKDKNGTTYTVDSDDVPDVVNAEKDDFMLVYLSGKDNAARMEVVKLFEVEILTDSTVTKFSTHGTKVVDKLTTGGTEYKTNPKAFYDKDEDVLGRYDNQLLTDTTYNIFLDRYDNVIGVDLYEGTKNYVFITGFDRGTSHISTKTADAAAIFLDGTMDVITVNVTDTDKNIDRMNGVTTDNGASGDPYFVQWEKTPDGRVSENRWYTYTVNGNGTYTLRPCERMFASDYAGETVLNTANLYVDDNGVADWTVDGWKSENAEKRISYGYTNKGRAYGEDASIYITVESGHVDKSNGAVKDAITDVKGVYTGIQDVKMEIATPVLTDDQIPNRVYTVYDSDHYIIASIVVGDAQGAVANYAYILSDVKSERYEANSTRANDGVYYWEFEAFYQGAKTTLTARTNYPSRSYNLNKYTIQELRFDGEYVTDVKDVPASKTHTNNTTNEKIEDMDIYDVGRVIGTAWPDGDDYEHVIGVNGDNLAGNGGASASRLNGTIYLQGRTLYVGNQRNDVGLALAKDAKALLVQSENYASVETREYNSVDEAVSNIADYNTTASGTQFRGRIAAVLDGRGAAEWVVIISDTELTTGNRPSYGTNDILRWTQNGQYWELDIPYGEYKDWTGNSTTTIHNWLVKAGCSNVSKTRAGWDFTYKNVLYYDQDVRVNWIYDDVVINTVNPTVPTVTTLADGAALPTASAEANANYTVSMTWTKDGAAYNDTKVNGTGTYAWTVTLTAKDGYAFANGVKTVYTGTITVDDNTPDVPSGGHWTWDNEAGGPVWVPDAALASMAKFARAARAGGNGSPFDQYIGQYIRITLENIGLNKEYTVYVTTTASGATTLKFGADIDEAGKMEIITHMNDSGLGQLALQPKYQAVATPEQEEAWKGNGETPIDPVEADTVKAAVSDGPDFTANSVEITLYAYGETEVTAELAAGAINAIEGMSDADIKANESGELEGKVTVVVPNTSATRVMNITFASQTPTTLFKVTYPGVGGTKTAYVEAGGKIEGIAKGVVYLIDATVDGGKLSDEAVVIKVDEDEDGNNTDHATMTGLAKDRDYVEAFKLSSTNTTANTEGMITSDGELTASGSKTATLLLGIKNKTGAIVKMNPADIAYVRAGAEITVQMVSTIAADEETAEGDTFELNTNNAVLATKNTLTVTADKKLNPGKVNVPTSVSAANREITLVTSAITHAASTKDYTVTLNGGDAKTVNLDATDAIPADAIWNETGVAKNVKVYYEDPADGKLKDASITVDAFGGVKFTLAEGTNTAWADEDGNIALYTVYTVAVSTGNVYSVFDVDPATEGAEAISEALVVKTGETKKLWVQAGTEALNAALTNTAGIKMSCVRAPVQSDDETGAVYEITVSGDIDGASTFTAVKVKTANIELAEIKGAGTASGEVLNPTDYDVEKVKVSFTPVSKDNENATTKDVSGVTVEWGTETNAGKIVFKNAEDIAKEASKVIGTVTVEATGPNGETWATVINVAFSA